jgi:hypothetical protein
LLRTEKRLAEFFRPAVLFFSNFLTAGTATGIHPGGRGARPFRGLGGNIRRRLKERREIEIDSA